MRMFIFPNGILSHIQYQDKGKTVIRTFSVMGGRVIETTGGQRAPVGATLDKGGHLPCDHWRDLPDVVRGAWHAWAQGTSGVTEKVAA